METGVANSLTDTTMLPFVIVSAVVFIGAIILFLWQRVIKNNYTKSVDIEASANMKSKLKPILVAIIYEAGFIVLMSTIHYFAYKTLPDMKFLTQVILPIGVVGVIPAIFKKHIFCGVFLLGGIIGLIADSIISVIQSNQGRPSMAGGFMFMLCIGICFIIGIVTEIVVSIRKKKREE